LKILRHNPTRLHGFSLTELLVVMAIVAMISGMLVGVVIRGLRAGEGAHCLNALRELQRLNQLYATDAGRFVAAAEDLFGRNLHRWHGVRTGPRSAFDASLGPLARYGADDQRVRVCPSMRRSLRTHRPDAFELSNGGYGYNAVGVGSTSYFDGYNPVSTRRGMSLAQIDAPAELLMFADTAFPQPYSKPDHLIEYSFAEPVYSLQAQTGDEGGMKNLPSLHFRHSERVQVVWTDGHTSSEKRLAEAISPAFPVGWFHPDNTPFRPF